jgi:ribonuclease HI
MGIGGQEHATNNQMELYAIRKALECNSGDIAILSDSQYALGVCLRRIRPFVDHLGLKHQIVELARGRLVTFEHVARQKNEAHHLVAMARKRLTV